MERAVWSDSLDKSLDPHMTLGGREGGKDGEEKGESQRKVNAVTVTCDYGHEVQGQSTL